MPQPIVVTAVFTPKEGAFDQLRDALSQSIPDIHEEEGCILYSLQRGVAEPDTFVTVEKWRSQDDLDAHRTSSTNDAACSHSDPNNPDPSNQIIMIEKWESTELLDDHAAGEPVKRLDARIAPYLAQPVVVTRLQPIPAGTTSQGQL